MVRWCSQPDALTTPEMPHAWTELLAQPFPTECRRSLFFTGIQTFLTMLLRPNKISLVSLVRPLYHLIINVFSTNTITQGGLVEVV